MTDNVIELIVKTTDQASAAIKGIAGQLDLMGTASSKVSTALAGLATGFTLDKLVESITAAQQATADLDRQFAQFGGTVGVSEADMVAFADTVSKSTTLTSESLREAQANLLNYTTVTGQSFLDARDLVADLASKMGGDAAEAATLLGRALQNPVSGIRLLAQVGVTLTQSQRQTIASLEQTGGAAQATAFIMDTLKQHLQGAAEAATNTLGGALTQLKNSFASGFTGEGADLQGLTDAIHALNLEVQDPEFQKALQGTTSFIVDIGSAAVGAVEDIRSLAEGLAHIFNGADTPQGQLEDQKQALEDLIAQPDLDPSAAAEYQKQLDSVTTKLNAMTAAAASAAAATGAVNANLGGSDFGLSGGFNDKPTKAAGLFDALQRPITPTATTITTDDLNHIKNASGSVIGGANPIDDFFTQELAATNNDLDNKYNDFLTKQVQREDLVTNHKLSAAKAAQENNEDFDALFAPIQITAKQMQVPLDDIDKEGKQVAQDLTGAFTSFFESGDLSAKNFLKTMLTVFDQIVAKALATDIVGDLGLAKLFNQPNSGGSQLGGLFGALGNLFGGTSSSSSGGSPVAKNFTDSSLDAAFLLGFAGGGQVSGGPMIVGEDGPEVFTPGVSGTVSNQRQLAFAGGGGGQGLVYSPQNTIYLTADNSAQTSAALVTFLTTQQQQQQKEFERKLARNGIKLRS